MGCRSCSEAASPNAHMPMPVCTSHVHPLCAQIPCAHTPSVRTHPLCALWVSRQQCITCTAPGACPTHRRDVAQGLKQADGIQGCIIKWVF